MTFQEALLKGDPFGNFWLWKRAEGLETEQCRCIFVVRTHDNKSTIFSCTERSYAQYVARVRAVSDLMWDYTLTDRSGDGLESGDTADMLAWARRLFHDV